ncbi:putative non-reducing polyketide synthase, partial [Lentinula raphanica]
QPIDAFFCPGTIRAFAGGRISHYLGWQGPCIVYDTACSSSLVAVHSACQSLVLHECDAAVAGAANMLTSPEMYSGLSKGYFISSTGDCRTFDESADGYCRAEGVGVVVLKRLEDALRDKDKIDAVIIASGVNQSGPSESLTTPHSETQAALFISNCKRAGISPLAIRVVEAHGTGTRAGDYAEMEAIKTAYCTNRKVGQYSELFVGSLKANVGHSESAAGMASLIKGALMAKHRQIPAHIGITTQTNSRLGDLEACGIRIPSTQQPLKPVTGEKNIYTAIHNFGAHGGNAAVIIQEPPIAQTNPTATNALMSDPRSSHVVVLSAKSHTNFSLIVERLLARIRSTVPISLPDLSYTTTARRMDYPSRIALSVSSIEELERQLLSGPLPSAIQGKDSAPRIGFLIGGNGSQYKGMGKILYQSSPVFQAHIDDCNAAAEAAGVHNLIGLINGAVNPRSDDLTSALAVTVGIFSVGYAAGMMWKAWGIEPHLLLG